MGNKKKLKISFHKGKLHPFSQDILKESKSHHLPKALPHSHLIALKMQRYPRYRNEKQECKNIWGKIFADVHQRPDFLVVYSGKVTQHIHIE